MDIVNPELVWVERRCYRFYDLSAWPKNEELETYKEETYENYESNDQESCDAGINIIPCKRGYKHSFCVNSHFFGFIIGCKGTTLKALQANTRTFIQVPKLGQHGDIVITAANRRDIVIARNRIDLIIETSRNKIDFTHFVGIPVNSNSIKERFQKFKEEVLKNCGKGVKGITEDLFNTPEKLHLTIVMLVILDGKDRNQSEEALEYCKRNIIIPRLEKTGPVTIELKGVEFMNDDPSEVNILYIQAHEESGGLQAMADEISDYYVNIGLAKRQCNKVKLHITAMNTKFLKQKIEDYNPKQMKFDATNIIKDHQNTFFGRINLTCMHLSQINVKGEDGYYYITKKIEF